MKQPNPLYLDTFTDADGTSLSSHIGDNTTSWTPSVGNTGTTPSIAGNLLTITNLNGGFISGPALGDVTVMFDNSPQASPIGIGPVLSASASISNGSYVALFINGTWAIFRGGVSGFSVLATVNPGAEFPATNTAADQYTLRLLQRTTAGVATVNLIVNGRQILSVTDSAPLAGSQGLYSNGVGTGTIDNFRVFPSSGEIGIALIGDSITFGLALTTPPDVFYGSTLSRGKTGLPVVIFNAAISGTTSGDWANGTGGTSLSSVITSLANQHIRIASIMLGANDAKAASRINIATHKANMATICRSLNAAGITVVLNRPTYIVPGAFSNGWDAASSATYLPGYWEAQQSLVNGTSILQGDTQGFDMIATDPANRTSDGVHPVQNFSRLLFQMHADALLSLFNGASGNSGKSNVNFNVDGGLP